MTGVSGSDLQKLDADVRRAIRLAVGVSLLGPLYLAAAAGIALADADIGVHVYRNGAATPGTPSPLTLLAIVLTWAPGLLLAAASLLGLRRASKQFDQTAKPPRGLFASAFATFLASLAVKYLGDWVVTTPANILALRLFTGTQASGPPDMPVVIWACLCMACQGSLFSKAALRNVRRSGGETLPADAPSWRKRKGGAFPGANEEADAKRTRRRTRGLILLGVGGAVAAVRLLVLCAYVLDETGAITLPDGNSARVALDPASQVATASLLTLGALVALLVTAGAAVYAGVAPRLRKVLPWARYAPYGYLSTMIAVALLNKMEAVDSQPLLAYGAILGDTLVRMFHPWAAIAYVMVAPDFLLLCGLIRVPYPPDLRAASTRASQSGPGGGVAEGDVARQDSRDGHDYV